MCLTASVLFALRSVSAYLCWVYISTGVVRGGEKQTLFFGTKLMHTIS